MEKKQIKKPTKKVVKKEKVDNVEKVVEKEEKRKNIIEIGKKIIIPVYKLEENEKEVLLRVTYDNNFPNYFTHVWFNKECFLYYKDRYYIEGEVVRIDDKDVELKFYDKKNYFTLLFRKNMIESEI